MERVFPTLYCIAADREVSVADVRIFSNGMHLWNILFNKDLHDWELSIVSEFFNLLYSTEISLTQRDSLKQRSNNHKLCTVKVYIAY